MNLDDETGISFMKLVKKLDEGPICEKFKVKNLKMTTMKVCLINYHL